MNKRKVLVIGLIIFSHIPDLMEAAAFQYFHITVFLILLRERI